MGQTITLSLISHTNVGKTTLARTLLRRDVGEVLDQAHVTDIAEAYELIEANGDRLRLWDTPGFGNLGRLLRRLRQERRPLGWFLHEVWDRLADRPLWCSQEAARNVRSEADVVLYLVNATEDPQHAGYVQPELELLTWLGRPVLLLLNQVGQSEETQQNSEARWRRFTEPWPVVRDVLPLDAFTRCWIEESIMLHRVIDLLPAEKRESMRRLADAWQERGAKRFRQSLNVLATYVAQAAGDVERSENNSESDSPRRILSLFADTLRFTAVDKRRAMTLLNDRLDAATRRLMDQLLTQHSLDGDCAPRIEQRIQNYQVRHGSMLDARSGALTGAVLSGALGGLAADALSGGLTLGGGMIAGGILGALGGSALARGYRWIGGVEKPSVGWTPEFLDRLTRQAALRYLAVAHFGRGRGRFDELEQPDHWSDSIDAALQPHSDRLSKAWRTAYGGADGSQEQARQIVEAVLVECLSEVLRRAYPRAAEFPM